MSTGWDFDGQPPAASESSVTLVDGSSFCVCGPQGNITPSAAMGLFVKDTRILSGWSLQIQGELLEPMATRMLEPYEGVFVSRRVPEPDESSTSLLVVQRRAVGDGMHVDISVRNLGAEPVSCVVELRTAADFADLFDVKAGRIGNTRIRAEVRDGALHFEKVGTDGSRRGVQISGTGSPFVLPGQFFWSLDLKPREEWNACVVVSPQINDEILTPRHSCSADGAASLPAQAMTLWRQNRLLVTTPSPDFAQTMERSLEDLASLRVYDPAHPGRAVVAAGVPWFMTLFGRDSLLSAWMTLPFNQDLAAGTLQSLADAQGTKVDPVTEEQPGRILHEVRFGMQSSLALGGGGAYYGTADATPLLVCLVGELSNWGASDSTIAGLLPAVDRALAWIDDYGDVDGDGFVEYCRATPDGLLNQGWKDSWDGVNFADGRLAEAPIALCEVQAYVYGAYVARAELARRFGDTSLSDLWSSRAAAFKEEFNRRFWLPEVGWYAEGLDRNKEPIDALTSNMGHALWTGVIDSAHADAVASHLMSPELFNGWGIRTLATSMAAYNPVSYHNGSVWPHDSAICAAGLMRYGFTDEAVHLIGALFDAASTFDGRLPELFCGFDRADYPFPVPYPTACSPQAWAAASPVLLLRTLLRLNPRVPSGVVDIAPTIPLALLPMTVGNVILGTERVTINMTDQLCEVLGLSPNLTLHQSDER